MCWGGIGDPRVASVEQGALVLDEGDDMKAEIAQLIIDGFDPSVIETLALVADKFA